MIQFVFFCVRLLSPKVILMRSIHVVAYSHNSLISIAYSILLYEQTMSWLSTHLLFGAITNTIRNVPYINPDVHIYICFCWVYSYKWNCWIIGDRASEMEAFNYMENSRNRKNTKLFSKMLVPVDTPTSRVWVAVSPHSHQHSVLSVFLTLTIPVSKGAILVICLHNKLP